MTTNDWDFKHQHKQTNKKLIEKETLCRREFSSRRLTKGGLLPTGLQGWPLKFVQHIADATCISPSPAGPPCSCPLHLLYLCNLSFEIGMPNRSCILELRANHCLICNILSRVSVPRCQCQIAPKKTHCLSCFTRNV